MHFMGHSEKICTNHITNLLGAPFDRQTKRNCFWPEHIDKRGVSGPSQLRFLSLEVSMALQIHANLYVPFKSGVCDNCRKYKLKQVTDYLETQGFPPVLQDASNEFVFSMSDGSGTSEVLSDLVSDISGMSISSEDNVAKDPHYTLPEEKIFEEKRKILNDLLKISGSSKICDQSIQKSYFDLPKPNQQKFR